MRLQASPLLFLCISLWLQSVQAEPVEIVEWEVPWKQTRPRDPYVDGQDRVWFCGQTGSYLAYFVPDNGEFKKYDLGNNEGPHNLIVDDGGMVWFAGNIRGYIGRLEPSSGDIKKFPMPDEKAGDPHTLVFDGNGDIWFTVQHGNFVGKLTRKNGEIRLFPVPTPRARPYGIRVDSDNRPWIALFGTNKLMTVDPETYAIEEFELPREKALPRRLGVTSDDRIWYVDYSGGYLGVFNPVDESFHEWRLPEGGEARPYAVAVDDRDRVWLVETGVRPNRFVGFDTGSDTFISNTPVPSGAGSIRHMYYHAPTQEIWFGTDANTIGKAIVKSGK